MKSFPFSQAERNQGIVTNIPTGKVAWSTGRNVRFKPGCVYKSPGKTDLATVNYPVREMFTFKGYDDVWRTIVCSDTKVFCYTANFGTVLDITPSPAPSSGASDAWQFALVGGMPVLSNGVNPPWKWDNFASVMTALSGVPVVCKAMHVHKNKLIVGNIQEGAYAFPARLRWADTMKPNGGWTKDLRGLSGGKDLVPHSTSIDGIDSNQAITSQGERLVAFCERNIYRGTPAEWPVDYTWDSLDKGMGLLAPRSFVKTPSGAIYFMGQEDFYILGEDPEGIGFNIRNSCFPNLNKAAIKTAFAYYRPSAREVVFCVPTGANTTPDTAFVFNEETKGWSIEDCDYLCHSIYFDSTVYTWDTLPYGSWDSITDSSWDGMGKTGILPYEIVGASTKIMKADVGYNNADGSGIEGYVETGDLVFDSVMVNKIIDEIVPILKPQAEMSAIMIQVGTRESLHRDIEWSRPQAFTIGVSRHINVRKMGKYVRLRFFTDVADSPWVLEGYNIKYSLGGSR